MSSKYFLKITQFEGPLDLLLYLIKVNEIDIFDIDIYFLTGQYLSYLRTAKFEDLADAGEFLQMAAHLVEIKSRMLLPNENKKSAEDEDDDDPRMPLQERLLEYEKFKAAGTYLASRPLLGVDVYPNQEAKRLDPLYEHIESPLTGEPTTLVILYEQLLKSMTLRKKPAKVTILNQTVTIEQTLKNLEERLEALQFFKFQSLYGRFKNRYEFVINIMAMLEMAKYEQLSIYQQELLGPIWLYKQDAAVELVSLEPEFAEEVSFTHIEDTIQEVQE